MAHAQTWYVDNGTKEADATWNEVNGGDYTCPNGTGKGSSTLQYVIWGTNGSDGAASAGDTIYLRSGTYTESYGSTAAMEIGSKLNAASWEAATTISSYPGEWAILSATTDDDYVFGCLEFDSLGTSGLDRTYIVIERLGITGGKYGGIGIRTGPVKIRYCHIYDCALASSANVAGIALRRTDISTILNLVCYAGASADTTAVTIAGYTTSADYYINIYAPNGGTQSLTNNRHIGIWDDEKYIITHTSAAGGIINNESNFTVIEGIQVTNPYTGTSANRYSIGNAYSTYTNVTVKDCIVRATGVGAYTKGIHLAGCSHQIINCIAYGFALQGIYASNDTANAGSNYIMNCTAYNCVYGICTGSADYRTYKTQAFNNVSFGCTNDYAGANWDAACSNNASEDGTAPGTDIDLSGYTAAQIWTDATNGDFSVKDTDSPLYDAGTDLSAYFTTDIAGTTRSSWDIGAFEYVSGE